VLLASSIAYVEALLGERFSYEKSMGILAAIVFLAAVVVIALGPEAKGIAFGRQEKPQQTVAT
jgi:O-antigen/teichoic acid export membrane protein